MSSSNHSGPQTRTTSLGLVILSAAPGALIALAVLLPFLNKAYTSDDVTFLLQAQHLLFDPLHPTAFEMVVSGLRGRLSHELVTGPVMAYLLIPSASREGAEWIAHLIQAFFMVMAALGTAALALRLNLDRRQATIASLLVVTTPAALGMAATAMPDVPAMAFAACGMERMVAWGQTRRWSAGIAGAILLALAALSRSHALLLLVCTAAWLAADERRRDEPRRRGIGATIECLIPVLLGLMLFVLVIHETGDPAYGNTITTATIGRLDPQRIGANLASFFAHWVVAYPLGILWPLLRGNAFLNTRRTYSAFALAAVFIVVGSRYLYPDLLWILLLLILAGHGLDVLADIVADAWNRRDTTQLLLVSWRLIGVVVAPYVQLPPKILLASAPAMAVLIAKRTPVARNYRSHDAIVGLTVLACVALGLLIIQADRAWAEVGREGGQVAASQAKRGRKVWMDGASGFQWYSMAAGAEPLATTGPLPRPGDVIVAGLHAKLVKRMFPKPALLFRRIFSEPGGRLQGEGAGFYTNQYGPLPWVWGRHEFGRIEVWRVDSAVRILQPMPANTK